VDKEENSRLGVYWLIKASEQGNVEATTILKHCLETGQGEYSLDNSAFVKNDVNNRNDGSKILVTRQE
jgi:TPR repeat protein